MSLFFHKMLTWFRPLTVPPAMYTSLFDPYGQASIDDERSRERLDEARRRLMAVEDELSLIRKRLP